MLNPACSRQAEKIVDTLLSYVAADSFLWDNDILSFPLKNNTLAIRANSYYFGHPKWSREYLHFVHRDKYFQERWHTMTGSWEGKVVVDIGCGPGNVYAALKDCVGTPSMLIGVDVSPGGLKMAQELGYLPVLADAQALPFVSKFADVVVVNASIHHCDDMEQVLKEAARLVKPQGILITDHDPQLTRWGDNIISRLIWNSRLPFYRLLRRGGHSTGEEQYWCQAGEAHDGPGEGVTPDFFCDILEPLGFLIDLFPHNRTVGADVLKGEYGRSDWNIRWAQRLSGVNPDSPEGALVMMCVAKLEA